MTDLDVVLSWNFWSSYWNKHTMELSKLVPGYTWPGTVQAYWDAVRSTGHRFCPSCHGAQILSFDQPVSVNGFEIERVYCVCSLSRVLDTEWGVESRWERKRLSELELWDKPKGAAAATRQIVETTKNFIYYPGDWIFLHGAFGSGKTHVANAVKSALRGAALYLNMFDLNSAVFRSLNDQSLSGLIDMIASAPVLILDDIGAEYPSPFFYSTLYGIINHRYAQKRFAPTFITSNKTPTDLLNSTEENYQRIGDRLRDERLVIPLVSEQSSYRGRG